MWKELLQYLLLDDRIWKLGMPMASVCNYCVEKNKKTLDHVLSTGTVAKLVWKKAALTMRVFNVESKPCKIKINRQFCGAKSSFILNKMLSLLLVIISWRLWLRQCNTCLEDKHDNGETVWRSVRFKLSKVMDGLTFLVMSKVQQVLEAFQVKISELRCRNFSIVVWDKLLNVWIKLNNYGSCRRNLVSYNSGEII